MFCAYYDDFLTGIIPDMGSKNRGWDRRSIELPPGWHDVMTALSERSGVALKYLYAVAIDRLLAKGDFDVIKDEAWILDESARTNLDAVGARYASSTVQKWTPKPRLAETRRSRPRRKQ